MVLLLPPPLLLLLTTTTVAAVLAAAGGISSAAAQLPPPPRRAPPPPPPPPSDELLGSKRFHQSRFLISYWVGPQVPTPELDERFEEIAAANFTGHLGFNGNGNSHGLYNDTGIHPTKERVSAEIALCDKYDLVCIPTLCGKIDLQTGALPEECLHLGETSPNFWGFQLLDEPSSSLFAEMANFSKALAAARPKALQYYNLLGSGAHNFVNQATYEQYWSSYIASVKPDVLSQDFYPDFQISRGEPLPTHVRESKERYAISLAVQRKAGLAHNVPFWNFLNAMPFSAEHADPTEAMLRWQVMTSLAYGASGYMYFCYWSPGVFSLGGGIIVPRGSTNVAAGFEMVKGPHYFEAQRINSVAKIYGGFLLGRKSLGVFRADSVVSNVTNAVRSGVPYHTENGGSFWGTDKAPPQPTSPDCAIGSLTGSGIRGCDQNEWLIGQFDLTRAPEWGPASSRLTPPPTHAIAILLANHDESRNVWSTVEWADFINSSSVLELDPVHGVLAPLRDDSPWHAGTQVALDAGSARLFVLQRQMPPPQPALHCDKKFGGVLVHINCVSGGCDRHFNVSGKEYRDECCAEDKAGVVDKSWTCCVKT
jgi:hypothetical protein